MDCHPGPGPSAQLTHLHNTPVHHGVQPLDVGLNGRLLLQEVVKFLIHCQTKESPPRHVVGFKQRHIQGFTPRLTFSGSSSLPRNTFNPGHPQLTCHSCKPLLGLFSLSQNSGNGSSCEILFTLLCPLSAELIILPLYFHSP